MKPSNLKLMVLLTIVFLSTIGFSGQEDVKKLLDKNIISLIRDKNNPAIIYAASDNSVYKTADGGKSWDKIYSIDKINKLFFDSVKNTIYVLTENGIYRGEEAGINWQLVFKGSSDREDNCLCLAASQRVVYLGTEEGLFMSLDQGSRWHKVIGQFSRDIISSIVIHPKDERVVFIASNKGVFMTEDNGQTWKRIYVIYGSEIPEEDYFESDYDDEYNDKAITIYDMVISRKVPYRLYIACKNGIFLTEDKGSDWEQITNSGLKSLDINYIEVSDDGSILVVATKKGVFRLEDNTWQDVNKGMGYTDFYDLVINENNKILISGIKGVYELGATEDPLINNNIDNQTEEFSLSQKSPDFRPRGSTNPIDSSNIFKGEPSIEDVQRAAIKYADVDINKIMNWRRQSRAKALCPDLSVSYDKTIYGSSTGQMAIGPRDWGLSLSWDVADLIWNSDETSIDSRSRLTVQLRQDVLDQVNRLYYERRRLKAELFFLPPKDEKEKMIKLLEIQEVTAGLDALTNGYFSKSIQ
jgi:photosystem II stability/assembly factor-like uncharacterized protein